MRKETNGSLKIKKNSVSYLNSEKSILKGEDAKKLGKMHHLPLPELLYFGTMISSFEIINILSDKTWF